jgi:hypothetical protein
MWALNAFAIWRGPLLWSALIASGPGLHLQPQLIAKLDGSLVRLDLCSARLSIPFSRLRLLGQFGIWRAFVMLPEA